ncbi:3-hydroxy-3-methylglutaryl-coenzyme A reductase 3-like [Humulus lupulus]|uniref:3-hydroxy-3-methylglutaryl-coenzyme A reductase 3-like n=1 Tax=Humulus lupulus TaxID=3486 RepID=UPI002B40457E|nr:3-hydroxy-3-methylglutaryl-coenzyme A reductase 3-like [Humulus lupulus]
MRKMKKKKAANFPSHFPYLGPNQSSSLSLSVSFSPIFIQNFMIDDNGSQPPCSIVRTPNLDRQVLPTLSSKEDEDIIKSVVEGKVSSYSLESKIGDCKRAAMIRREALQRTSGRSLQGLPLEGFDYESILGQCCKMPIRYVQISVGIAGPLLLDGFEYSVLMATTEGCLIASTNRGCKAIHLSGGATSMLLRDGMTRTPVVRFNSAKRASELKFFLEDPKKFETISIIFNRKLRRRILHKNL